MLRHCCCDASSSNQTIVRKQLVFTKLSKTGFTLIELLVVVAIIGILLAITIPAVQAVRSAAQKSSCSNNIRQINIALIGYQSAKGHFPSGIRSSNANHYPSMSWLTAILPYVEQNAVADIAAEEYGSGYSPFSPHVGLSTPIAVFGCPSDSRSRRTQWTHENRLVALTSYVGVCGTDYQAFDGILFLDSQIRSDEILDGLSNTIVVGERPPSPDNWYGWWYAGHGQDGSGSPDMLLGVRELNHSVRYLSASCGTGPYVFKKGNLNNQCSVMHYWSLHSAGSHFGFADGSTRFLTYDADTILPALATISGGEVVGTSK